MSARFNGNLLVTTGALVFTFADSHGGASYPLTISGGLSAVCPWGLAAQWLFLTNAACPGSGLVATSGRLEF